jgi:hypothetical protein
MGEKLYIPDPDALSRVEPHRRFIALVVLLAVRDRADRVRFELRPDEWGVFAGWPDGSWEEYAPVAAEATVARTVRALTRPGWAARLRARLGAAPTPSAFALQLGRGASVRCRVTEGEGGIWLWLELSGTVGACAGEVVAEYGRMRRDASES